MRCCRESRSSDNGGSRDISQLATSEQQGLQITQGAHNSGQLQSVQGRYPRGIMLEGMVAFSDYKIVAKIPRSFFKTLLLYSMKIQSLAIAASCSYIYSKMFVPTKRSAEAAELPIQPSSAPLRLKSILLVNQSLFLR